MDRYAVIQVVAMLVVLSSLMRWLPVDDPRDSLGRGDPWRATWLDRELVRLGVDSDEARSLLRSMTTGPALQTYMQHWSRLLRRVRAIQEEAGPDTFVQFNGLQRNDLWRLRYDLYPIRTSTRTLEEGSSYEDEVAPGAEVIGARMISRDELSPEELELVQRVR